jgi:hypothetical protein
MVSPEMSPSAIWSGVMMTAMARQYLNVCRKNFRFSSVALLNITIAQIPVIMKSVASMQATHM